MGRKEMTDTWGLSSRLLNEKRLDSEDRLRELKNVQQAIESTYSDFQQLQKKEETILAEILMFSKGTEAESTAFRGLEDLEEERQVFTRTLATGEETLLHQRKAQIKEQEQLETAYLQAKKEESECQK